jgi:hypothetical protein
MIQDWRAAARASARRCECYHARPMKRAFLVIFRDRRVQEVQI